MYSPRLTAEGSCPHAGESRHPSKTAILQNRVYTIADQVQFELPLEAFFFGLAEWFVTISAGLTGGFDLGRNRLHIA